MSRLALRFAVLALAACVQPGSASADSWVVDRYDNCIRIDREAAGGGGRPPRPPENRMDKPVYGGTILKSTNRAYKFHEMGYLMCNPDVEAMISKGRYKSATDHFCAVGKSESRRSECPDGRLGTMGGRSGAPGTGAPTGGRGGRWLD